MTSPMPVVIPMLDFARSGGQRVLSRLATEWTHLGLDVTLLTHVSSETPYFPTQAHVVYVGNDGRPAAHPRGAGARNVHPLIKMNALRAALSRFDLKDGVALANHNLTAWPVATARGVGRRLYYIQAYEPEYFHSRGLIRRTVLWQLARASYRLPLQQVVNSPLYLSHPAMKAKTWVPAGIDLKDFHSEEEPRTGGLARSSGRANPRRVIGCIGRKEAEKGTADVLEAFLQLRERGVDAQLRVAYGSVPDRMAARDDITVVVPANDAELGAYYRSLDVLVAPGHLQIGALHYPVLEGMASCIPVIHTGYMPGTEENSWIVPVKDPEAIARTLEEILGTPREDLSGCLTSAAETAAEFSWPEVAAQWMPILRGGSTQTE